MRRFSSAHAIALIALFVGLGGTGYAAATITSSDVRDGSLTGRDVKDRSVTGRDVRDRSLRTADLAAGGLQAGPQGQPGPQGQAGPDGSRGPAGPQGPAGATGSTEVISATRPGAQRIARFPIGTNVLRANVPAGAWAVTASMGIDNDESRSARVLCALRAGDQTIDEVVSALDSQGSSGDHVIHGLTGAVRLEQPAEVRLRCIAQTSDEVALDAHEPVMSLVAVDRITQTRQQPTE